MKTLLKQEHNFQAEGAGQIDLKRSRIAGKEDMAMPKRRKNPECAGGGHATGCDVGGDETDGNDDDGSGDGTDEGDEIGEPPAKQSKTQGAAIASGSGSNVGMAKGNEVSSDCNGFYYLKKEQAATTRVVRGHQQSLTKDGSKLLSDVKAAALKHTKDEEEGQFLVALELLEDILEWVEAVVDMTATEKDVSSTKQQSMVFGNQNPQFRSWQHELASENKGNGQRTTYLLLVSIVRRWAVRWAAGNLTLRTGMAGQGGGVNMSIDMNMLTRQRSTDLLLM